MKVPALASYLLISCIVAAFASGCTRAQARVAPEMPALDIPLPPPRSVETYGTGVRQTVETPVGTPSIGVDDGIRAGTPDGAGRPTTAKPETTKPPEPVRTDGTVAETLKPPDEPRPTSSPLQTQPRQKEEETAAAIQTDMNRARSVLGKIDYQKLATDPRSQYETARNYILQAEAELKAKNFGLARTLTDKAATIADQLSGR